MTDAIISDVHANWEALSKVFEDIDRRGIQSVLCLGDVVGYGPDPDLCLDLVRRRCSVYLMGNHEEALIGSPVGFYPLAREALALTRRRLFRPWWKPWRALGYRRLLSSLPRLAHRPQCLLVHGSPRDPTSEYLFPRDFLLADAEVVAELFAFEQPVCFTGHTHIPCVFTAGRNVHSAGEDGMEVRIADDKFIINVGSVGQPRDRDPRACYVEFTGDRVIYHRIPYDVAATQRKIIAGGFDQRLAERLGYGV
ncbi:MAG TPA: metallophosphoesterase family protein [Planctomycetota bacterium]|mgnify:FL=1|nr:metallophosphoesterase [Planctomycetota bacterium]OQC20634.1 MAG: phosphodiesterase [Planctomycetes bacterium ADurb.Bin069]NMD36255.1 metallophosphoesterase [Planctomycetota bacterium]HNR98758.1 metallophosphoesterase family protein [Planctomycetota bacterium]HNU25466.1 metallophosphoesterase family protein [Planctomycetota bacterium]